MSVVILSALLRANLAGSAAILLILVLRRPLRRRLGPLAAYLLWAAAPLFILAALIQAHPSAEALAPAVTLAAAAARAMAPLARRAAGLTDILIAVWAAGAVAMAVLFIKRQAIFVRSLGRLQPLEGTLDVLRGQHRGAGPFVLGSLRPRIVTPADFDARFEGEARRLVLAHEDVHLARGDATINGLVAVVQCLAWFNPLAHVGARRLRVDQEIACDAAVVACHPHARRLYAETLLTTSLTPWSAPFGCHWPAAGPHCLKERLTMLNLAPITPLRRKIGVALVGGIAMAGAGAVWAANPAPPALVEQPVWSEKPDGADVARNYPAEAAKAGVTGGAVIDCDIAADGRLRDCTVRRENPARYGFGKAALKLSTRFKMQPTSGDGHPTAGGAVRIPIRFFTPAPKP